MDWDKATDVILLSAIAILGVFGIVGLCQLISRKSIKKVDKELLFMLPSLILMSITYFVFDKLLILNTRPDGSGEPSFPSTHVMVVTTIFLMIFLVMDKYIKSTALRVFLSILMLALVVLVSVGRVLAEKHWPSDVVGGLIFSLIFAGIYLFLIKKFANQTKESNE